MHNVPGDLPGRLDEIVDIKEEAERDEEDKADFVGGQAFEQVIHPEDREYVCREVAAVEAGQHRSTRN